MESILYCLIKKFEEGLRILENLHVFGTGWYRLHEDFIVTGIRFGIIDLRGAEKKRLGTYNILTSNTLSTK